MYEYDPTKHKTGSMPFWKASIVCAMIGGVIGAIFALIGV